jgi:hypothetical protein
MCAKSTQPVHRLAGDDIAALARYCEEHLDLAGAPSTDGCDYACLPLGIIDAVFSLGAHYASTRNTVRRFCAFVRSHWMCKAAAGLSVSDFLVMYETLGIQSMAEQVYQNRQRTSPRHGILKAEAALRFAETLRDFGVEDLKGAADIRGMPSFEATIRIIPGQGQGTSLLYFYMLTGSVDHVKPDRWAHRFVEHAIHRSLDSQALSDALVRASALLREEYPHLTPRALDALVWRYQQRQPT